MRSTLQNAWRTLCEQVWGWSQDNLRIFWFLFFNIFIQDLYGCFIKTKKIKKKKNILKKGAALNRFLHISLSLSSYLTHGHATDLSYLVHDNNIFLGSFRCLCASFVSNTYFLLVLNHWILHGSCNNADILKLKHVFLICSYIVVLDTANSCRWLLGYPITYLFNKEHGEKAMRNLSFKSIYHYKLFASRFDTSYRCY